MTRGSRRRPETTDGFDPIHIQVVDTTSGPGLGAVDDQGRRTGILIPPAIRPVLEELLATSGPRFLQMWKHYQQDRGGEVFFWDLADLATVITESGQSWARKMTGAR